MRTIVVGAGVMGTNHARTAAANRDVELVGVVDADLERASTLAAAYGGAAFRDIADVEVPYEAAIIATPTPTHRDVALPLLRRGVHVLLEKPIAPTVDSARELLDAARQRGVVLMVGLVERCSPVVLSLPPFLDDLVHIEAFRIGPFTSRVPDSVVLDLMIHDIDIAIGCAGPVRGVSAISRSTRSASEDLVSCLLTFESGVTASITASRIGQNKVRELRLTRTDAVVNADLLRGVIEITRVAHTEFLAEQGRRYRQSGVVEIPFIDNQGEPLAVQLRRFVAAVEHGEVAGVSERSCGIDALEVALQIIATCRTADGGSHASLGPQSLALSR